MEEFKPKGIEIIAHISDLTFPVEAQFLPPIHIKSPVTKDNNISRMMLTEAEDEDAESVTCTVEESDHNCPEEDILVLRLEDEFTEECDRLVLLDLQSDNNLVKITVLLEQMI